MKINRLIISLFIFLVPALSSSQSISDYVILQDIGPYKVEAPQKVVGGYIGGPRIFDGAGSIALTGHFYIDHSDKTYEAYYQGGALSVATVQVTQHSGSDSDKWLLHELEDGYRDDDTLNATVDTNVQIRTVDSKNIYFIGIYGAKSYAWISDNNIVVKISCSSCPNTKPEPIDVVKAYLAKFPSSITLTDTELKSRAHSEKWIKDEMDRRLWLCDKWFGQSNARKTDQKTAIDAVVKSMNVFLDYREKYYGVKAEDDKNILAGYVSQNDNTGIQTKLAEYKAWWLAHKADLINLP